MPMPPLLGAISHLLAGKTLKTTGYGTGIECRDEWRTCVAKEIWFSALLEKQRGNITSFSLTENLYRFLMQDM